MKYFLTPLILVLLLIFSTAHQSRAENFLAMTAPYPPYSSSNGLQVKGMSVSTLTTIMGMCHTPIQENKIKLTPWAYAYESTARHSERIVLNALRTVKTEHLYKWVGPVTTSKIVLIGKAQHKFFIRTKADLAHYRIATIRWSRPEKTLIDGGISVNDLTRSPSHVQALRRLDNNEVDLFAFTQRGASCLMQGLGMKQDDYTVYYTFEEEPLYFAFSKETDDKLIAKLNRALKEFKATGQDGLSQFDRMFPDPPMQN